ncbi:hypothetical protein MJO28_013255 [Puccinia striiformis f. sp. tritici]|uniref:Uncharacterized protein n=1 Tax=Puccinia striiformis f. sp. tritici TaxID=168172 RepID=A0ACC0DYW5_9BASI|nr:hypothetical protein MJO28_013255 [Puccinia striiformis f. sp. tritici]
MFFFDAKARMKMIRSIYLSLMAISILIATASGAALPGWFDKGDKRCYYFYALDKNNEQVALGGRRLPFSLGDREENHPEKLRSIASESSNHMMILTKQRQILLPPRSQVDLRLDDIDQSRRILVISPWNPEEAPTEDFQFSKLLLERRDDSILDTLALALSRFVR